MTYRRAGIVSLYCLLLVAFMTFWNMTVGSDPELNGRSRAAGHLSSSPDVPETERFDDPAPPDTAWTPGQRIAAFNSVRRFKKDREMEPSLSSSPWVLKGPNGMEVPGTGVPARLYSGRVLAFDLNPRDGLYICSAGGGVFDGSFDPITDDLPSLATTSIAVHPTRPDTMFVGTGEWRQSTGTGLYRSFDRGKTWTQMSLPGGVPPYIFKVMIPPWNLSTVFVACNWGLYRSSDLGTTWSFILPGIVSDIATAPGGSPMLAGVWDQSDTTRSGLYRSVDYGLSWYKDLSSDLPQGNIGRISLAIAPSDPSRAYIQITNRNTNNLLGMYRTDYAVLWNSEWFQKTPGGGAGDYMNRTGWYSNAIGVNQSDKNIVWVGGVSLLRSSDGGDSWADFGKIWFHADVHAIYPTVSNRVYVGCDGGVAYTFDEGSTWISSLNAFLPITQFYNIDAVTTGGGSILKYGGAQDNGIDGTTDPTPDNWLQAKSGDGMDVAIDPLNSSVVYMTIGVYNTDLSFRRYNTTSAPGGWDDIDHGISQDAGWSTNMKFDPSNPGNLFTNAGPYIYWTTDGGATWPSIGSGHPGNVLKVRPNSNGSLLYYCTDKVPTDFLGRYEWSGSSWGRVSLTSGILSVAVENISPSLSHPDRAYVLMNPSNPAFSAMRIFKTTDRGDSYVNVTGNLPAVLVRDLVESPSDPMILWAGTNMGVFKTVNGGATWYHWNTGMPTAVDVRDLKYLSTAGGDVILAGTFGRGVYQRDPNAPFFIPSIPIGRPVHGIEPFDGGGFAVADSGIVAKTFDIGGTWAFAPSPASPAALRGGAARDHLNWFACGDQGAILRTINGGAAWSVLHPPVTTNWHGGVIDREHTVFFGEGAIVRTPDDGTSWETVFADPTKYILSLAFSDSLHGWAAGLDRSGQTPARFLLATADGGQTWVPSQWGSGPGSFNRVHFADGQRGYLFGDAGFFMRTTDGGSTWLAIPSNNSQPLYGSFFRTPEEGWAGGGGGTLLHTTDGGLAWQLQESGTTADIHAVSMIGNYLLLGSDSGLAQRRVPIPAKVNLKTGVLARWNMLSLPVTPESTTRAELYPQAVSQAYAFENGYVEKDTLEPGVGYWLKFNADQDIIQTGLPLTRLSLEAVAGWNMIGALSDPIDAGKIMSVPAGIIASPFFSYENGYKSATILQPGKAYWIKTSQAGQLTFDLSTPVGDSADAPRVKLFTPLSMEGMNLLTMEDRNGCRQTLYFSTLRESGSVLSASELPPPPPAGSFDVRFASNRLLASSEAACTSANPIKISGALYPVTLYWEVRQNNAPSSISIGGRETPISGRGNIVIRQEGAGISLLLPPATPALPAEFALEQNYPNPFNPATTIRYALPGDSKVSLKIYNVLGQEVATIVDEFQQAGFKTVRWDASSLPTGIYLYRIVAGSYTETKKMVLMR